MVRFWYMGRDLMNNDGENLLYKEMKYLNKILRNGHKTVSEEEIIDGKAILDRTNANEWEVAPGMSNQEALVIQKIRTIETMSENFANFNEQDKKLCIEAVTGLVDTGNFGVIKNGEFAAEILLNKSQLLIEHFKLEGPLMNTLRIIELPEKDNRKDKKDRENFIMTHPNVIDQAGYVAAVLVNSEKMKIENFDPLARKGIIEKVRDLNSKVLNVK